MTDILPSEEFWLDLGFEPSKVIGHLNGPKVRKGLTGWSENDLKTTLEFTKERHHNLISQPRDILPGLIVRNAPKTAKLLTLMSRFVEDVKPSSIKKIAELNGILDNGLNKHSLVLKTFFKDNDLLHSIRLQDLTAGLQMAYPYWSSETIGKSKIASNKFKEKLVEELKKATSLSDKEIRLDRMETIRGSDAVTFYIEHEDEKHLVKEMRGKRHYDKPSKWTIITFSTKSNGLEIRTSRRKVLEDVVNVAGEVCFGNKDSFHQITEISTEWENNVNMDKLGLTLENQILRSVTVDSVNLDGTPSITLSGLDVIPAIKQLVEHKGIVLESEKISGWEVILSIKKEGVVKEISVLKKKGSNRLFIVPKVPFEYRSFIYLLNEKGMIPKVSLK